MASPRTGRLLWQQATVVKTTAESATARTIVLDVPQWSTPRPGQHVDIRLTAPDGYQATRSYSLSSAPNEAAQITVERVEDGEVSPFLVDIAEVGDTFEIRGPIGGYFVWDPSPQSVLLIGGGSGIAPLRSMWRAAPEGTPVTVLYSARDRSRVIFGDELEAREQVTIHLTRETVPGFAEGRIHHDQLRAALTDQPEALVYVCGPTAFVEAVTSGLSTLIDRSDRIRTERFG